MPTKDEVYAVWAPEDSVWSPWVKPVLFSFVDSVVETRPTRSIAFDREWVPVPGSTAIILDLPNEEAVLWALKLAALEYRPVPLYNALPFPSSDKPFARELRPPSAVDAESILSALIQGCEGLRNTRLAANAPPAFLLDADRRLARVELNAGVFDNRSVCFSTDFPSADFLLKRGITSVVVVQENTNFARDLIEVLVSWQAGGLQILRKSRLGQELPVPVVVKRPGLLGAIWFRMTVALGLRRSELGGFGGIIPAASG
jgi:hypothetical protein